MDPERQPLLRAGDDVRCRRYRPLTYDEVLLYRQHATWRRARFSIVLMFWAIMAMFITFIVFMLIRSPKCGPYDTGLRPWVAPVHMSLSPLMSSAFSDDVSDPSFMT